MKLEKLKKIKTKKSKRVGRGYGSGKGGHTVGRGQKGQRSRSGRKSFKHWLRESRVRSLPKLRGIGKRTATRGYFKKSVKSVIFDVSDFEKFRKGTIIDEKFLRENKLIKGKSKKIKVKILGDGKLSKSLTFRGLEVSKSAQKKIEAAKGKVLK